LVALLAVGYLVLRAVRSRPILSLTSSKDPVRSALLRIVNQSDAHIMIREVIFQPEVYGVYLSSNPNEGAADIHGSKLGRRIAPHTAAELPLLVRDAALEAEIKSSVRIIVRWRKTRALWSPQVPAGLWISTEAVHELSE
jgi:hypothetical protein